MSTREQEIDIQWPFQRCIASVWKYGESVSIPSWKPGAYDADKYDGDERTPSETHVADAFGAMILTEIVRVPRIGHYPARVLFIRQWRDPDCRTFGKRTVRMCSMTKWTMLLAGYRTHVEIVDRGPLQALV